MNELKWNWVYYPYLDAPNKQAESALKAGYIKVVIKDEADKVIAELKSQKAQAEDDCAYWKTMARKNAADNTEMAKQRAEALKRECHHKYKRCLAMAKWCDEVMMSCELRGYTVHRIWANKHQWAMRWKYRWLELAEKFKEAK